MLIKCIILVNKIALIFLFLFKAVYFCKSFYNFLMRTNFPFVGAVWLALPSVCCGFSKEILQQVCWLSGVQS